MKKLSFVTTLLLVIVCSCRKDNNKTAPTPVSTTQSSGAGDNPFDLGFSLRYGGADYSQPIAIDTANKMIESYLTSIGYPENQYNLRSLSFDADTLRSYLNDTARGRIVTIKFMLAHKLSYINGGKKGINCGTNYNGLTMVIVGLNEEDEYIYNRNNKVYDNCLPCPIHCDGVSSLLP